MQLPGMNRWHPVLALRYLPMLKAIQNYPLHDVVEIGSGGLGIGPYLKKSFIGIDVGFEAPLSKYLIPVKGSALCIPLKSNSVSVVISSDMLEHVPGEYRIAAISELIRVATKCVVIGVPVGELSHLQDIKIDQEYKQKRGVSHPFLTEHVAYGLPESSTIMHLIAQAAKKYGKHHRIEIIPNQNLAMRYWLMKGWISKNLLINIFFRKILLLFIPLMRSYNRLPVYREIFIIHLGSKKD